MCCWTKTKVPPDANDFVFLFWSGQSELGDFVKMGSWVFGKFLPFGTAGSWLLCIAFVTATPSVTRAMPSGPGRNGTSGSQKNPLPALRSMQCLRTQEPREVEDFSRIQRLLEVTQEVRELGEEQKPLPGLVDRLEEKQQVWYRPNQHECL